MNFEFSEDQKFVQKSARDLLAKEAPLSACRAVLEGGKSHDAALWKTVAENGYVGAVIPETHGGAGMGYLELVLIAHEIGRSLAPIPFGPSVYLATEAILHAGSEAQKKSWLPRLGSGDAIGTFAFAEGAGDTELADVETRVTNGRLSGEKVAVEAGDVANVAIVVAKGADGRPTLVLVDLSAPGITRTRFESFDPSRGVVRLRFENTPVETLGAGVDAGFVSHLLDRAAAIQAFEQIGAAERVLEMTREFTMNRYAFGRPVASFQVLKHRMAELFCAIEIARSNAYYAAWALSSDEKDELAVAAASARVAANDAFTLAAEEMIQMYGGVGYTWEYDCHLFYRRARHLALLLGSSSAWREKLVQRIEKRDAA